MGVQGQTRTTIQDDVVTNNGVSDSVDAFENVPDHVAFDDVHRIAAGAVHEDSPISHVVDDVVANRVRMRSNVDFDAITLSRSGKTVMNPVLFDQRIPNYASGVVATHVHTFARSAVNPGVVDMILPDGDVVHVVGEIDTHINIVDYQVFQSDEGGRATHVDAVSAIADNL